MGGTVTDKTNNVYPFKRGHGSGDNGGNGNYGERLARLEERLESSIEHMATKEDIQKIKVWVLTGILGGMLGGMGVAAALAVTIAKLFFSS